MSAGKGRSSTLHVFRCLAAFTHALEIYKMIEGIED